MTNFGNTFWLALLGQHDIVLPIIQAFADFVDNLFQ